MYGSEKVKDVVLGGTGMRRQSLESFSEVASYTFVCKKTLSV